MLPQRAGDTIGAAGPGGERPTVDYLLLVLARARPAWQAFAACRGVGPDAFFSREPAAVERAERFCQSCAVAAQCLAFAVEGGEQGRWGGTTEEGRGILGQREPVEQPPAGVTTSGRATGAAHGTRGCYQAGCRCDPCREAAAEGMRARRAAAKANLAAYKRVMEKGKRRAG